MISRKAKETFYLLAGPLMSINGWFYRTIKAPSSNNKDFKKVQLGPGQSNYFEGWINIDANIFTGKADIWADLRNKLPFRDNSIDFYYSHHVVEHLPNIQFHFNELFRTLKPNGKIRIGVPNGHSAILKYLEGDSKWFGDFPDSRESIGGRLENFIYCRQEHLTILTPSYLSEIAQKAGFKEISFVCPAHETSSPDIIDETILDKEMCGDKAFPITLVIEAVKQ